MRQSQVQSLFLQRFGELFPRLRFRAIRRFTDRSAAPYAFALRVAIGQASLEIDLLCAVMTEGYPDAVRRLARAVAENPPPDVGHGAASVLIAPYFSPEAQALCREAHLGYLDLAGNAGLDTAYCYLEIAGKENPFARKHQVRTPFSGRAERVARRLLLNPERAWTMRALAEAAQVSLGLASMVTSALAEMGAVRKGRSGLSLADPGALLNAWAEVYDLRSSPFVPYRAWEDASHFEQQLVRLREALRGHYALTLWSGAHQLLRDEEASPQVALYWEGDPALLARALNLSRDVGKTYVFVFQPYDPSLLWQRVETADGLMVAHPLQLYLDLGSGDERELALAQRVRERLLPW